MTKGKNLNLKLVEHLVNGNFAENLCRICLTSLDEFCESIFTKICKEDREYCIADVLEDLCGIRIAEMDNYCVCHNCFVCASSAYKFYLQTKRNNEILSFYVHELESNVNSIILPDELTADSLCITLPEYVPATPIYDYNIVGINTKQTHNPNVIKKIENRNKVKVEIDEVKVKKEHCSDDDDDKIVMVMMEDGQQIFFKPEADGSLSQIDTKKCPRLVHVGTKKARRKREPMTYKQCSRCPIKYRFVAKLKEHMRTEHNVILYVCKVCQALMENEEEFVCHLKTHTNIYQCATCNTVFKKRDTVIAHLKWHEENKTTEVDAQGNHVCKICGEITKTEEEFKDHCNIRHFKKYTCYYCGRMYKGELSFNLHIEKHEKYEKMRELKRKQPEKRVTNDIKKQLLEVKNQQDKKFTCETCGRNFLGDRALLWHNRLHTNERPYTCDVCGRGFVSLNRRNQHALCAHTVPTRRCPLCPALFHLRSMVNTHIKKVHLKAHKRRNRTMRHQQVFWNTEPVPIQELSVSIQNEILELQANQVTTKPEDHDA